MENKIEIGDSYLWRDSIGVPERFSITKIENGLYWYTYEDGTEVGNQELKWLIDDIDFSTLIRKETTDNVVNPPHYTTTKISALEVVNDWDLGFYLGNTIKYIKRYKLKGKPVEDLKKAQQYLQLFIDLLEKEDGNTK